MARTTLPGMRRLHTAAPVTIRSAYSQSRGLLDALRRNFSRKFDVNRARRAVHAVLRHMHLYRHESSAPVESA